MISVRIYTVFFMLGIIILSKLANASQIDNIQKQILLTSPKKSLILLYDNQGKERYRHSSITEFIPASTLKIATSLIALKILGEDYHFITELRLDAKMNLHISGSGDPFLVSEEITKIAKHLQKQGYREFSSIIIDDSAINWQQAPGTGTSENPYDAANGGLIVNFNTIHAEKTKDDTILSAEEQTPLTQIARTLIKDKPPGTYRINLGSNRELSLTYSKQIFTQLLAREGIQVLNSQPTQPNSDKNNPANQPARLLLKYKNSKSLTELITLMLKYSNNFIANQIGLALFASKSATIQSASAQANSWLKTYLHLEDKDLRFEEFSGISRYNRLTANAIIKLLEKFKEYSNLLQNRGNALVKSGTLENIYNYAGYLRIHQQLWPIVIITYSKNNNRDQLLELIQQLGQQLVNQ